MNACESDLPIQVMKLLGVPKTTRHDIYSEVSGEVEALQELGSGTYEALATVIKWVCSRIYHYFLFIFCAKLDLSVIRFVEVKKAETISWTQLEHFVLFFLRSTWILKFGIE